VQHSSLTSFTSALSDDFLLYYLYHGVSTRWSGFPGNPDHPSHHSPDYRGTTVTKNLTDRIAIKQTGALRYLHITKQQNTADPQYYSTFLAFSSSKVTRKPAAFCRAVKIHVTRKVALPLGYEARRTKTCLDLYITPEQNQTHLMNTQQP
jgi:hypothetical protein